MDFAFSHTIFLMSYMKDLDIKHSFAPSLCNESSQIFYLLTWPGWGSWRFQNTRVCITSSPPPFALAIKDGHI